MILKTDNTLEFVAISNKTNLFIHLIIVKLPNFLSFFPFSSSLFSVAWRRWKSPVDGLWECVEREKIKKIEDQMDEDISFIRDGGKFKCIVYLEKSRWDNLGVNSLNKKRL